MDDSIRLGSHKKAQKKIGTEKNTWPNTQIASFGATCPIWSLFQNRPTTVQNFGRLGGVLLIATTACTDTLARSLLVFGYPSASYTCTKKLTTQVATDDCFGTAQMQAPRSFIFVSGDAELDHLSW